MKDDRTADLDRIQRGITNLLITGDISPIEMLGILESTKIVIGEAVLEESRCDPSVQ